jgi:hypothetical protein
MIFVLIASIRRVDLNLIFFFGLIIYFLFYLLGAVVSRLLSQINEEVELKPVTDEDKKTDYEKELVRELDFQQGAELPSFD